MRPETPEFEEKYLHEKGFSAYFKEHIASDLIAMELRRKSYLNYYRWASVISYTLIVIFSAYYVYTHVPTLQVNLHSFMLVVMLYILGSIPAHLVRRHFEKQSKIRLMDKIIGFFKDLEYKAEAYLPRQAIVDFLIVPAHTHYKGSDFIEFPGKYSASRLLLEQRSGTGKNRRKSVKFRGVGVLIDLAHPLKSPIALKMDQGQVLNWLANVGSGYQKILLVDPVFEKIFEVFGKDQIEARAVLTPDVMELFLRLNFLFSNWKSDIAELEAMTRAVMANHNIEEVRDHLKAALRANYMGDKLLLMFKTPEDLFEPVSLKPSCLDLSLIRSVLYQIDLLNQLHAVLTRQEAGR